MSTYIASFICLCFIVIYQTSSGQLQKDIFTNTSNTGSFDNVTFDTSTMTAKEKSPADESNEETFYYMGMNGTLMKERNSNDEIPLYILALYPLIGQWSGGQALIYAVQIGVEFVNARKDLLPGYSLNIIWNNTKVCLSFNCQKPLRPTKR